jgi:magnesium chelatase family protein
MTPAEIRLHCSLGTEAERVLARGHETFSLSGRGWDSAIRVARTLADLGGEDEISPDHVKNALSLRRRPAS